MEFTCSTCGEIHDLSDISFGADSPAQWELLTNEERSESELGQEQCIIEADGKCHYFVRGCLEIPVKDQNCSFTWGVWVSLSEASFVEVYRDWDNPQRSQHRPYFGWLSTKIPEYPDTMFLKTMVHQRGPGLRPIIELEPTDHPLSIHQRDGIDQMELASIVSKLLHS